MGKWRIWPPLVLGAFALATGSKASAAERSRGDGREVTPERSVRSASVVWTAIALPSREKRPDLERFLRRLIDEQTTKANWGGRRAAPLEAQLLVTELSVVSSKDVVRVTCTGVGRLQGGQSARSHFSMGGRPSQRGELELQLLTMLGRGIVGRLAEIARAAH